MLTLANHIFLCIYFYLILAFDVFSMCINWLILDKNRGGWGLNTNREYPYLSSPQNSKKRFPLTIASNCVYCYLLCLARHSDTIDNFVSLCSQFRAILIHRDSSPSIPLVGDSDSSSHEESPHRILQQNREIANLTD